MHAKIKTRSQILSSIFYDINKKKKHFKSSKNSDMTISVLQISSFIFSCFYFISI